VVHENDLKAVYDAPQCMHLALAFTGRAGAAVEQGQHKPCTTDVTLSNVLLRAAAVCRAASAVCAVGVVDEHERGLLMSLTISTLIHRSCRGVKHADHCERGFGCSKWIESKRCGSLGRALGGFWTVFIPEPL